MHLVKVMIFSIKKYKYLSNYSYLTTDMGLKLKKRHQHNISDAALKSSFLIVKTLHLARVLSLLTLNKYDYCSLNTIFTRFKKKGDNHDLINIWKIFIARLYILRHAENQEDSTNLKLNLQWRINCFSFKYPISSKIFNLTVLDFLLKMIPQQIHEVLQILANEKNFTKIAKSIVALRHLA